MVDVNAAPRGDQIVRTFMVMDQLAAPRHEQAEVEVVRRRVARV